MSSDRSKPHPPGIAIVRREQRIYTFNIDTDRIEVTRLRLTLPRLSPAFDGYRLVQFSDIHMGTGVTPERLARVIDMVNAEKPDLIAVTGDFVSFEPVEPVMQDLIPGLKRLSAKDGVLAILGNHDHHADAEAVREIIREGGLTELSNAVHTLRRRGDVLHIAGVDDHWYGQDRLEDVLTALPDEGAAILLAHEPDFADISAATGRFDLQLSGHSHGGQIVMPFVRTSLLPRHAEKYPAGQYQVEDMILYTNRGIGMTGFPIRINCRPEITVFTLETPRS
jgi:uncharacterized protein